MIDLAELLGHRELSDSLTAALAMHGTRRWLRGPSGSGKTAIARRVADLFVRRGGTVHWLSGAADNPAGGSAAYRALKGSDPGRKLRQTVQGEVTTPLRDVPVVGNTLAALARILIARFEASKPDFLTAEQQDLLSGFERASLMQLVLFVIDDVHLLDQASAAFLTVFTHAEVGDAYPFARRASLLFVEATDQHALLSSELLDGLRQGCSSVNVQLPERDQYPQVLAAMGLERPLDADACRSLYDLTRGHLKLAREIVRLVNERDDAIAFDGKAGGVSGLAAALLRARLSSLPHLPDKLERLLVIASCLGKSFSRRELECAFAEPKTFSAALEIAQREEYISADGDALQFTHEIVQAALRHLETSENATYYDRLTECLRHLRPGDYRSRYLYSSRTANTSRTAQLLICAWLQEVRGEALSPTDMGAGRALMGDLADVLDAARRAVKAMDRGEHSEAIEVLLPFYDGTKGLIQGEIAYLLGLNYYKKRGRVDYEQALSILKIWATRREEGEIWFRLMLTLAVVQASLGDRQSSSETLQRVRVYLDRKLEYDPTARVKLQVLNRKAEIFYPIEVAGHLIETAANFFAPPPDARMPRNAFQYTAALVNLSGNLYVRGEFTRGMEAAGRAIQCMSLISSNVRVVEPYRALNNYAISAFRAATMSPAEAINILTEIAGQPVASSGFDRSLVAVNLGAMHLCAGNVDRGLTVLEETCSRLRDYEADGYYLHYATSNLAAACLLAGQFEQALNYLSMAERTLNDVSSEYWSCLRKRLEALRRATGSSAVRDASMLDALPRTLLGTDGPHVAWRSLGWGFIFSDIQVWSES